MDLSMNWLKDFVDLDCSIDEFIEKMTMSGSKVEGYQKQCGQISKIVVGKVLKIKQHPDADRLVVCDVDVAYENPLQIVTGAKNLKEGDLVPVALNGSTLADGRKIKKGKLRGILSEGMMCSLQELGLCLDDFPYAIEDGIFVIEEECCVGQDVKIVLGLDDVKVEFEITSNRPDCYSVLGLAREAAATFDKKLKFDCKKVESLEQNESSLVEVEVVAKDACPFYSACVVKNVKIGPSPKWMRQRLRTMGVRPINNVVDVTNYVMLELGQPMHVFDLSMIDGGEIIVRFAQEKEKLVLLDDSSLSLKDSDLVIADKNKPLALAGIMGGKFSGVTEKTVDIVFESACFDGSRVRKTSKRIGVKTESSSRFERKVDSSNCTAALVRACELLKQVGAADRPERIVFCGEPCAQNKKIKLDRDFINSFLSLNLAESEIVSVLEKIGCRLQGQEIIVPSYRPDLECKADIAEEVARFYGYNKIKSSPLKGYTQGGYTLKQKFKKKVINTMLSLGLNQVTTYSFMDPLDYDRILLSDDCSLRNSVEIRNPLGKTSSVMRSIAIPSMLETLSRNFNNKNNDVRLFEIAKEYVKTSENELPIEKEKLVAGMYCDDFDFFSLKGILEDFLDNIFLNNYEIKPLQKSTEYYHPGKSAQIVVKDVLLGTFGQVHPNVCCEFNVDRPVYVMHVDIDLLFENKCSEIKYKRLPKFPSVTRDLCLICDEQLPVGDLEKIISDAAGNILESVNLFDVYCGEQIPAGKKSVAFNMTLRSCDATLEEKQISFVMEKIVNLLSKNGVTLRK